MTSARKRARSLSFSPDEVTACSVQPSAMEIDMNKLTIDMTVVRNQFRPSRPTTIPSDVSLASMGRFDMLPTETMYAVIENMTLSSLLLYKAANTTTRAIVETWPPYRQLIQHGDDALRAMVLTRASDHFTTRQLLDTLYTETCCVCGDFAAFIYTLKCSRCCFRCLSNDRRLLPITLPIAKEIVGISVPVPSIKTIARDNFWGKTFPLPSLEMVDYTTAASLSPSPRSTTDILNPPSALLHRRAQTHQTLSSSLRVPDFAITQLESHPLRFLAFFRYPVLHLQHHPPSSFSSTTTTTTADNGRHCLGCQYTWNALSVANRLETRVFSLSTIGRHLRGCHFGQALREELRSRAETRLLGRLGTRTTLFLTKRRRVGLNGAGWESVNALSRMTGGARRVVRAVAEINAEDEGRGRGRQAGGIGDVEDEDEDQGYGDAVYDETQAGWCVRGSQNLEKWLDVLAERQRKVKDRGDEGRRRWNLGLDEI